MPPPRNASRGINEVIVERQPTKKLSLRCCQEQCHFSQSAVVAFTLAEVLITLGIIGVVAALTLPNLIANHKAIEMRTRFKTAYSLISQAVERMKADGISTNPADYGANEFQPVFIKYFPNAKDCGTFQNEKESYNCPQNTPTYKDYSNTLTLHQGSLNDGQFVLTNGMLILIENPGGGIIYISVDINGVHKKPNRLGHDLFMFDLKNEKLIPSAGICQGSVPDEEIKDEPSFYYNGQGCAKYALTDPDYFKKLP